VNVSSQPKALGTTISVLAILFAGGFLVHQAQSDASTPQLTKSYTNDTYRFSLMMPADFAATAGTEIDPNASTTVLLQNRAGDGVQILISPWDEPTSALTAERVTQDTGLTVTNAKPIAIPGGVGLSFNSDNDAFDGASSDIWFVHDGNVYELTTYARLDPLLHAMFATWRSF
jgi:hypothetical protein